MRFEQRFYECAAVGRLLSQFEISQGPLFHYTRRIASAEIQRGKIRLTRADCFLDTKEIQYGLAVLTRAGEDSLDESQLPSFSELLKAIRARLQFCFILSLSKNPDSGHLRSTYSGVNGAVVEVPENFPRVLYRGWHATRTGDGSFGLRFVVDLYDFFEGNVIYDAKKQRRIAVMACEAWRELRSRDAHVVDGYHFIDSLLRCLVLFKSSEFEVEDEYRIALVRRPEIAETFESTETRAGRTCHYVAVRIPNPQAAGTRARDV